MFQQSTVRCAFKQDCGPTTGGRHPAKESYTQNPKLESLTHNRKLETLNPES